MKSLFVGALLLLVFYANHADAATLYLDPATDEVGRGGTSVLTVRLGTNPEQCINALDGVLRFDEGLEVEDVSVGNSIFNFWVEPPTFSNADRLITFAGGVPNGYCGRVDGDPTLTNSIVEIIVRPKADHAGGETHRVYFDELTTAYLNDGAGTPVAPQLRDATVAVTTEYVGGEDDPWLTRIAADDQPPKEFSIALSNEGGAFQGRYYIVFNTNDKQTGIDHYEVIEEPLDQIELFGWGAATAPWVRASSPYVLSDQSLNSTIRVKAVDKAGNEYIATLVPEKDLRGFNANQVVVYGVSLLFASVFAVILWFIWHVYMLRRAERRREEVAGRGLDN